MGIAFLSGPDMYSEQNPAEMGEKGLHDMRITVKRIPRASVGSLCDAADIVEKANQVLSSAHAEADRIRRQAHREGVDAAKGRVSAVVAEALLAAQQEAAIFQKLSEPRVTRLVFAVLKRILPQLPVDKVVTGLITEVMRSIHDKSWIRVVVHPDVEEVARDFVEQWQRSAPGTWHIETATDRGLSICKVRVESQLGAISAGVEDRFEQIIQLYEQTLKAQSEEAREG
ncbi:Type III secretory pathway protein [gamma proteobacterium HdN1]|nr:Type III secretory pathway protein [gamma proteobacterium HdN1]